MARTGLEMFSHRIGVSVSLAIRLFDAQFEQDKSNAPRLGPAAREPGEPLLRTEGTKGTSTYRRIWTVQPPASGASIAATAIDEEGAGPALVGGADAHLVLTDVLPRKVQLRLNSHRVADESELELPIDALPFPPDGVLIRSILVEVRRGVIAADDWADALARGALSSDGRPLTVPVASDGDDPDFVGFVDKHRIRFGDAATTVLLPCRDLSSVLADTLTRGREIETHLPADEAVARFLSTLPAAVGFSVVWLGGGEPPTVAESAPKAKRPKAAGGAKKTSRESRSTFLDAITDFCTLAAVTPRFRGYRLELGPARTLDQFDAGEVPRMVFGANVEELELEHRLTQAMTRAVEVRSFSPDTGLMVIARWPDDPTRFGALAVGKTNELPPTGPLEVPPGAAGIDEAPPTVMIVQNVTDPRRLRDIARNIFDELARQDVAMRLKTTDIATVDGRLQGLADLLTLAPGDPIGLAIAPAVEEAAGSYVQRLATMSRIDAIETLTRAGYRRSVAERVVDQVFSTRKPLLYRVREVHFDWSLEGATTTDIQAINYVEVRDREYQQGGPRLAQLPPDATNAQKWDAIDDAMLNGELSIGDGLRLQGDLTVGP
jgi:hypothetical protein